MRYAEVTSVCRRVDVEDAVGVGSEIFRETFHVASVTANVNLDVSEWFERDFIVVSLVESF